ncbi:Carboxypeptidase regulatory-like domain-containing protein [Bryocella elongata]|uniref:Carboxypeptidase regulatory-like domain-containing protein n=1 Tax=Bryocella elongata TaxID=863522 RepID=A0A1H5WN84_9BACT|nr:TonB-dependent receptor [Bryocella elongata]SEG00801.1 Carboxypeptidase regulatory-like domain-containing protein [Bryocella elongata]
MNQTISIPLQRTGQCIAKLRRMGWATGLAFAFCLSTSSARAQLTTADILGTVTDPTGADVPNATVTLKNLGTNETRTVKTDSSGNYIFPLLAPGHYSISVAASGFKASRTPDLAVEAGDRARADEALAIGAESEVVNVEAQTPLLQSDNSTVSSTVTAQAVQDLPLNGRNYVQLVQLVPGANEGPGNGLTSGGRPDDRRPSSSFSVNGQDDTLNNTTVDGIDDNERIIGTTGIKPVVEAIQEITVQTNNYTAEAGRTAGGVVSIITRQGTNKFHGTAYEFFRNDIFDARNVSQQTGRKPELRQNQFGGSFSGPIFRDRTFFFGDYEGLRTVSGVTYSKTVPDMYEYDAIHSLNGETPQTLINAGNGTAGNGIDPIALNYLMLFPAPNTPGCTTPTPVPSANCLTNNSVISPNKTQSGNSFDVRVDHKFNDRNLFFGRYDSNKYNTFTPPGLGTVNGIQVSGGRYDFDGPATDYAQQYGFGFTHIFTANLLVDLRAAYTRINNFSAPLNYGTSPDTKLGFGTNMNFNQYSNYLTPIQFGPFSDIGDGAYVPLADIDNSFQYQANVSYTRGNHNFKAGASYIRRQARNVQSSFAAGQYGFGLVTDTVANNNVKTQDNNLASSLVGAFSSDSRNYDLNPPDYRTYEPSFFVEDNWKVTSAISIQLGVRYDVFTPFTEAHSHISNFDFNQALGSNAGNINSALKIANVNGVDGHAGIKTDYSNVAPRIGFSARIRPGTVLRGGYGMSFFPGNYTSNADLKNIPFVSVFSPNCQSNLAVVIETNANGGTLPSGQNGACSTVGAPGTFDAGLPVPSAPVISSLPAVANLSFVAEDPKFRSALIQQFNLQIEQQFGPNVFTIGYVGNTGQHLPETINDINSPAPFNPDSNPAGSAYKLGTVLPLLSSVGWMQSEGMSNYNALQMSFQRRFSHGLSFDTNYTWGKAMSDITGFSAEGGGRSWSNADPTRIRQIEYGVAENDIKNRFASSVNYALPFGKNFTGFKKALLGGYQINSIAVWQSGKPFDIVNSGSGNDVTTETIGSKTYTDAFSNRSTPQNSGGPDRPNIVGNPHVGHPTLGAYFNTAAFAPQPMGTIGTTQRDALFGPHYRHVDLSLFKDFTVTERVGLQFRAECFNVSNTPSYYLNDGSGNVQLGNSSFGTVTNADPNYTPRQFQFALKASF